MWLGVAILSSQGRGSFAEEGRTFKFKVCTDLEQGETTRSKIADQYAEEEYQCKKKVI